MYHFQESITNLKGDGLVGYFVKAVDPDTGTVQDIYADESLTPIESESEVENAALVDGDGMASFWIDDGTYHLDIYGSDASTLIRRVESVQMGIANPLLESISELTFGANNYIYGTGTDTAAAGTITAFGRSLVDDTDAATARTTLGATTVGSALVTLANPSAITFLRVNADNSVSALSAAAFRSAIGAGTGSGDLLAANNLSDIANAATARSNLGLAIGSNVQAYDAELAALASVTSAADKVPYFTGSGTADVTTLTAFARTVLDDADAATVRSTIGAAAAGYGDSFYVAGPPTPPVMANFSWFNQGTSTASDGTGALVLRPQPDSALRGMEKVAPATPFDIYCRLDIQTLSTSSITTAINGTSGITLGDSSDGERLICGIYNERTAAGADENVNFALIIQRYTGTTFSASPVLKYGLVPWQWVRVNVTSTTVTLYGSMDGKNWVQAGTEAISSFVDTIDRVGFGAVSNSGATEAITTFSYWSTTAPA